MGRRLQLVEVRSEAPQEQQIPLELKELHLVQRPLLQMPHGAADVPKLHQPLPEAAQGGLVPQYHGLAQVFQLHLQGIPFRTGIGAQGPLFLPAQRA